MFIPLYERKAKWEAKRGRKAHGAYRPQRAMFELALQPGSERRTSKCHTQSHCAPVPVPSCSLSHPCSAPCARPIIPPVPPPVPMPALPPVPPPVPVPSCRLPRPATCPRPCPHPIMPPVPVSPNVNRFSVSTPLPPPLLSYS